MKIDSKWRQLLLSLEGKLGTRLPDPQRERSDDLLLPETSQNTWSRHYLVHGLNVSAQYSLVSFFV